MMSWELETWLSSVADNIVRKLASSRNGNEVLDSRERLIYEMWLFDTEFRNGGVSQYFCNWGLPQWDALLAVASPALPSLVPFAAVIRGVVDYSPDPYKAVIKSDVDLDSLYRECREQVLLELRKAVE